MQQGTVPTLLNEAHEIVASGSMASTPVKQMFTGVNSATLQPLTCRGGYHEVIHEGVFKSCTQAPPIAHITHGLHQLSTNLRTAHASITFQTAPCRQHH
jgi:hypothetical protein